MDATRSMDSPDSMPVKPRKIPTKLLGDIQVSLEEELYVRAIDTLSLVTFQGVSNPKLSGGSAEITNNGAAKDEDKDKGKDKDKDIEKAKDIERAKEKAKAKILGKDKKSDDDDDDEAGEENDGITRRLVYVPPPEYMAIITTLTLHPEMTSKRRSIQAYPGVADRALRYLSNVIRLVGPNAAGLQEAWKFNAATSPTRIAVRKSGNEPGRRRRRPRNDRSPTPDNGGKTDERFVPFAFLKAANEESAFARCEDGWAFLGWAFACSVEYPRRWAHYIRFLTVMRDALRADWKERNEAAEKGHRADARAHESLAKTMGFLPRESQTMGSAFYKRLARAIFADGSEASFKEWMPVFQYEVTKRPRKGRAFEMFKNLDPDHPTGLKSRYDDGTGSSQPQEIREIESEKHSESDCDDIPRSEQIRARMVPSKKHKEIALASSVGEKILVRSTSPLEDEYDITLDWGGMDSIVLRQQFMCLICEMHQYDGTSLQILYDEFAYTVKNLSLEEMELFVTTVPPHNEHLTDRFRSALWQFMLRSMIGKPFPEIVYFGDLSDELLVDVYLPATATKSDLEWNTKVAVLVEALARLWMRYSNGRSTFVWTEELEKAAEEGIKAREDKAAQFKRNAEEFQKLKSRHDRLRMLVQLSKRLKSSE